MTDANEEWDDSWGDPLANNAQRKLELLERDAEHARAVELRDAWRAYWHRGGMASRVDSAIRAIIEAHGLRLEGDE